MHFNRTAMAMIARRALWVLRCAAVAWRFVRVAKPARAASLIEDSC